MSIYNIMNGVNPSTFFILPMLGRHPDEYPRFRDCFINKEKQIEVYTRVGGNNRNSGYGEDVLYEDLNYVRTYDDDFDNTYGTYVFNVPKEWKEDFDKIIEGRAIEISDKYFEQICKVYPKLSEKLHEMFNR